MKPLYKTLAVSLLGLSLISGCGAKQEVEKTLPSKQTGEQSNKQEQSKIIRLLEKKLSYTENGKTYEEMAYLKTSENQSFSLYVLEGWELEAEEPNSDVLLKDDSFVRIRLIQPEYGAMDYEKMVEDQAKAVSADAVRQNTDDLQGLLRQAVWYKAYTSDTAVNVIWIKENVPMMVTIQTPRDQEVLEPIFAMLSTVEKTEVTKPNKSLDNPNEPTSSSNGQ
ncbi:hypothetical protein HNQ34_003445 [Anoxybacillus tepidamans]|uniref:Lipoprotein n=1 Tax=Anoxybacteroides tepidamans TaxID=265948 RepID=A0A7W8IUX3_9BACL|nr:hypothetical protein [Anoxybacillus tepidamans]MBB5326311.1 hypothetical protein [Anoxybacillus tepidamans]